MKLIDFKKNVHSQNGEDGIIEKIFEIINPFAKICIEIGCWDATELSNTANLWKNKDWSALLVEIEPDMAAKAIENTKDYKAIVINCEAGFDHAKNSIDYLWETHNQSNIFQSHEVDFLSIDIDGNDYYLFESLKMKPKVICIEYNASIPYFMDCYQSPNAKFGCSLSALIRIGKSKGYTLVCVTDCNAIFVQDDFVHLLEKVFVDLSVSASPEYYSFTMMDYLGRHINFGKEYNLEQGVIPESEIIWHK